MYFVWTASVCNLLILYVYMNAIECGKSNYQEHFERFSEDFEDEMKAYDSNEDLFGAYIVIHYFEIAYEIMNRSAVDTELSNTIEKEVQELRSENQKMKVDNLEEIIDIKPISPVKGNIFKAKYTSIRDIFKVKAKSIEKSKRLFSLKQKHVIIGRFMNRNWDAVDKLARYVRMRTFLYEYFRYVLRHDDYEHEHNIKPNKDVPYERDEYNNYLDHPSVNDLIDFIQRYARFYIQNYNLAECIATNAQYNTIKSCIKDEYDDPLITHANVRGMFELRSEQSVRDAITDTILGREYLEVFSDFVEQQLNENKILKFEIIAEKRCFEIEVYEIVRSVGFHQGFLYESTHQTNYQTIILDLFTHSIQANFRDMDAAQLGKSIVRM